jgi:hypothetical protein
MKKTEMYESITRRIDGILSNFDAVQKNNRIRIEMLEAEVAMLQPERKVAFPVSAPASAPELPKRWEDLGTVDGFFIKTPNTQKIGKVYTVIYNKNVFAYEKEAASALAMAQLSQLMKVYRAGWEPNWTDPYKKWCIYRQENELEVGWFCEMYCYLSFPTKELAEMFLANFRPLINQYFMI